MSEDLLTLTVSGPERFELRIAALAEFLRHKAHTIILDQAGESQWMTVRCSACNIPLVIIAANIFYEQ